MKVVFATYDNLDEWMSPRYVDAAYGSDGVPELRVRHRGPLHKGIEEQRGRETATALPPPPASTEGEGEGEGDQGDEGEEEELRGKIVATRIISAAVNEREDVVPLQEPIVYTLEHITVSAHSLLK